MPSTDEVEQLLATPDTGTVLGLRDRAILSRLDGTGIRASECASLRASDVDLDGMTLTVTGKGGHQRTIPLNERVVAAMDVYARARGAALPTAPFFRSRRARDVARCGVQRVRTLAVRARIRKVVSPHRLRHTFATHLVKAGVGLVTIRDLLGHRLITSTADLPSRHGARPARGGRWHPIGRLLGVIEHLQPDVKLPMSIRRTCAIAAEAMKKGRDVRRYDAAQGGPSSAQRGIRIGGGTSSKKRTPGRIETRRH